MIEYRQKGYIKEAIINYMSLLGWHPDDDRELLSFDEIIKEFSLERVQKSGAIFDEEKLKWFNKQYLQKIDKGAFIRYSKSFFPKWLDGKDQLIDKLVDVLKTKIAVLSEIEGIFSREGELAFVNGLNDYNTNLILWKKNPSQQNAKNNLSESKKLIDQIPESHYNIDKIKNALWNFSETNGKGDVLWPLRVALTGQEKSPDPFTVAFILGKDEALKRIDFAIQKLS